MNGEVSDINSTVKDYMEVSYSSIVCTVSDFLCEEIRWQVMNEALIFSELNNEGSIIDVHPRLDAPKLALVSHSFNRKRDILSK